MLTDPGPFMHWLLSIDIVHGPARWVVEIIAILMLLPLVIRHWRWPQLAAVGVAALLGGIIGGGVVWLADSQNWFGINLYRHTYTSVAGCFALLAATGVLLVLGPRWWRRVIAGLLLPVALVIGVLEVNEGLGVDVLLADLLNVSPDRVLELPVLTEQPKQPSAAEAAKLWQNWQAPTDMPNHGIVEQVQLSNSVSGFESRPAGLYLPPAALVADPPTLPFVVLMMGQPGNPDPRYAAAAMEPIAERQHGLAPIVLVVDQLGNPYYDPLCTDSARFGKVETFLSRDVPAWAISHLRIDHDPAHWLVAGYSSGGSCALKLGADHPELWQNVLSVSGERYPGSGSYQRSLDETFNGNAADYRAQWPENVLPTKTYPDTMAIFTGGANDVKYLSDVKAAVDMTRRAGWDSQLLLLAGADHFDSAMSLGFSEGFAAFSSRLGVGP